MSIFLELPTETEHRLQDKAAHRGLTLTEYLQFVAEWESVAPESDALSEEQIARLQAGIRRGLDAEVAGRTRPLAGFVREQRAKHDLNAL